MCRYGASHTRGNRVNKKWKEYSIVRFAALFQIRTKYDMYSLTEQIVVGYLLPVEIVNSSFGKMLGNLK